MSGQTDFAWAAGFFDGEGCINLSHQGRYHVVRLILVQKDIRPLQRFVEVFQCSEKIGTVTRTTWKRPYYRLTMSGGRACDVLQKMLPYLTLKRDVAMVALDLQATMEKYTAKERSAGLPDSEIEYRKTLVAKAKWLNSGRWTASTTERDGSVIKVTTTSDSLNSRDDKAGESAEMPDRLQ